MTGKGVTGTVDGRRGALGNRTLLSRAWGSTRAAGRKGGSAARRTARRSCSSRSTARPAGLLGVADPIKETTPEAIRQLHAEGIRIVMLTGDSRTTAEAVARKLGIDEVIAEVLPDQKADAVKRLQAEGRIVAMAGDGINDAPALAQAQVGIAMGTGTDVAMESAGVTLVKGDLRGIVRARRLSRATMRNIKQNLFFAFVYNALGVPIAAGVLYPFFGILLSPDHRRRGDELQLRLGRRQCVEASAGRNVGNQERPECLRRDTKARGTTSDWRSGEPLTKNQGHGRWRRFHVPAAPGCQPFAPKREEELMPMKTSSARIPCRWARDGFGTSGAYREVLSRKMRMLRAEWRRDE